MNSFLHLCLYDSFVKVNQVASILFEINLRRFGRIFRPQRNLFVEVKCSFVDLRFWRVFRCNVSQSEQGSLV